MEEGRGTAMDCTVVLVKPDAGAAASEIVQLIESSGVAILAKEQLQLTGERAEALCAARRGAAGFEAHVAHLCSGPLWVLLLAGPGTLQKWLQMMGPPDPSEARVKAPKSLRALYGKDVTRNAVDGSLSAEAADREVRFFFPQFTADEIAARYKAVALKSTVLRALAALPPISKAASKAVIFLSDAPRPPTDVTQRGVSLAFLLRLTDAGAMRASWSIQEAVDNFVRPATAKHKCCLFDIIPPASIGRPQFFISHTWSRQLRDLLALLKAHFKVSSADDPAASVKIWLDIVAIDQHPYEDRGCLLNDDVANLSKVVAATERTLFCLDAECVVLTRIWCLYEVWQTLLAKGAAGLLVLMRSVETERLQGVFKTFDAMHAQATQPADRERILSAIAASIGATELNLQLKRALVDSAVYESSHTAATGAELAAVQNKAATMLQANGEFDAALPLFRDALAGREAALGATAADSLTSLNNLAGCLTSMGRYDEALPLYQRALEGRRAALGASYPDTLASLNDLAICMHRIGRSEEALALLRKALAGREAVLGPHHAESLATSSATAACLKSLGRHAEALPLYERALQGREALLGAHHPDTSASAINLAVALEAVGRHEDALPLLTRALEGNRASLGAQHPDTLASLSAYAGCLSSMGRHAEALPLYNQALEGRLTALGPAHPSTLTSTSNAASCLFNLGDCERALPLFRRAYEGTEVALGPAHRDTDACLANLCSCLALAGAWEEAAPLWRRLLSIREASLGAQHGDSVAAASGLAVALKKLGAYEEAVTLFRRVLDALQAREDAVPPAAAQAAAGSSNQGANGAAGAQGRGSAAAPAGGSGSSSSSRAEVLAAMNDLAGCLYALGDPGGALPLFRAAYEGARESLGEGHEDTQLFADNLAVCEESLQEQEEQES